MKMYQTTSSDYRTLSVFATSADKAGEIVSVWVLANALGLRPRIGLRSVTPAEVTQSLMRRHLIDALKLDIQGLGEYDPTIGWLIRPPRDERDALM